MGCGFCVHTECMSLCSMFCDLWVCGVVVVYVCVCGAYCEWFCERVCVVCLFVVCVFGRCGCCA